MVMIYDLNNSNPIHRVDVMLCRVGDAIWECVLRTTHVWLCRRVDSLIMTCCIIRVWCGLMMFLSFTHALGKVQISTMGIRSVGYTFISYIWRWLCVAHGRLELRIVRKPPGLRGTVNRGAYAQVWQYGAINWDVSNHSIHTLHHMPLWRLPSFLPRELQMGLLTSYM